MRTSAKTRKLRRPRKRPVPYIPIDDEYCCEGLVTIPVEDLDTYQQLPFGTPAWKTRSSHRLQIENVNGMLKNKGGLEDGWC